jgi:hypothetical protein
VDRRTLTVILLPTIALLAILAYFFILVGTVTIQTNSLDPGAVTVAGKAHAGTSVRVKLPAGSHTATFSQADYQPLSFSFSVLPLAHKTVQIHPQLTALGAEKHAARQFAADFTVKYGTYTYQSFAQYAVNVRSFMTPQLYQTYFSPAFLPQRESYLVSSQFSIVTTTVKTSLRSFSDTSAVVDVDSRTTSSSTGTTDHQEKTQTITLVRNGSSWLVSAMSVQGQGA